MKDSPEFKIEKRILKISTIEQLVQSYLVADVLNDMRKSIDSKNTESFINSIPDLEYELSDRGQELYSRGLKMFKFKPVMLFLLKFGFEDMVKYNFKDDPSVTTAGSGDTAHLNAYFGSKFTDLANIDLEEHTLNVFEEALNMAEFSGRGSSLSFALLGSLFHDYGKSTEIKKEILGSGMQKGFKPHSELSQMYIQDLLLSKLYNIEIEGIYQPELIESLAHVVKNHHPGNAKLKQDIDINFVVQADHMARKKEFEKLKLRKRN